MRIKLLFTVVTLTTLGPSAMADKPAPPFSHTKVSANGKFVFVMLSPLPAADELKLYNEEARVGFKAIRDRFQKSGLYKNDGSKEPIWTVDWYRHEVDIANDGVHLVRHGRWPSLEGKFKDKNRTITKKDLKQEAVSFFAKGKLLREYTIGEVVDRPGELRMTVSHFMWRKSARLVNEKSQFELGTLDGNLVRFDLTTAKIIEKKKVD